ncbi:MAG: hypothetical protein LBG64_01155, partial [Pseudomonadales bacterium]|nr:hypothetical protein [Pseudomonadales bacterium]
VGWVAEQAVPNGSFRILIPAATTNYNDGIPDLGAFDYGTGVIPVQCPQDIPGVFEFGTPISEAGAVVWDGMTFHSFVCPYVGDGQIGAEFGADSGNGAMVIGDSTNQLINPLRDPNSSTDIINRADQIDAFIQNLDADGYVISSTQVAISAILNEVVVTAYFPGEISFRIRGLAAGTSTACGVTDMGSTATLLNFGSPQLNVFTNIAQRIEVISTAAAGYSISVMQSDQMSRGGVGCPGEIVSLGGDLINRDCIPDFAAAIDEAQPWTDPTTQRGLGFRAGIYSLEVGDSAFIAPDIAASSDNFRRLADVSVGEIPEPFVISDVSTNSDLIDVCFRLNIDAMNHAGVYENQILYVITATF